MVSVLLRKRHAQSGVRPFDPYRDPKQVTNLIGVAFGDTLGPDGQIALAEMRRAVRWGPLLGWLYWPGWQGAEIAPGFVWVEEGRVVGNLSLRRVIGDAGYLIGNVAVHPDWRRRGIANGLMKAALEAILAQGRHWVGLEVRADNHAARRLYERWGFRDVGRTTHMLRPAGLAWARRQPHWPAMRRGESRDSAALFDLVRAAVPELQRPLLELRQANYAPSWERALNQWFEGRREVWWVIEENGEIHGAVRALHEHGRRPDRLEVLVAPGNTGHFETGLIERGLSSLRGLFGHMSMVETMLVSPTDPLVTALEAAGFERLRVLTQMRLDRGQRIPLM